MQFKDILNKYLKETNSTSKELSTTSGISESVISRYRSGKRTPNINSPHLSTLATSLSILSKKNIYINENIILKEFTTSLNNNFNYENLSNNLNNLITTLNINMSDMSKYITFDPSHISRIRYGKSKPSDPYSFSEKVSNYINLKYNSKDYLKNISTLIDESINLNEKNLTTIIYNYLTNNTINKKVQVNYISNFLNNLDNFNLSEYIKDIKFDELKVPSIPFYHAKTRNYYGLEEMKQGELDFFKATVLSKNNSDIFMCSDMPMEDMAKDIEFGKKWMFAIAMCLKKGLHLNIIHNLNRPFNEMMLGLLSWIPIYMTNQVSPYYFKDNKNNIYNHLNYVSGVCALTGESLTNNHHLGKYYLTTNKKELSFYQEKANILLKKANSLMDIYNINLNSNYQLFLSNSININTPRVRTYSTLPLFTISKPLLIKILKRNNVSKEDEDLIISYYHKELSRTNYILENNTITDNIYKIDAHSTEPLSLSLENIFYQNTITYTHEEYLSHFKSTIKYQEKNKNYHVIPSTHKTFNNITIINLLNHYTIISKNNNPTIHFVIKHPHLRDAITSFTSPIKEKDQA